MKYWTDKQSHGPLALSAETTWVAFLRSCIQSTSCSIWLIDSVFVVCKILLLKPLCA